MISNKLDINKIAELYSIVWSHQSYEKVYNKTKWAFDNNFSKVLTYHRNEELISVRGGIYWPLFVLDRKVECIQFHGTCVHPGYRRQGIFTSMNKKFLINAQNDGVELIFNVSVDSSRKGYEKLGWRYIKGFRRLTHLNNPLNILFSKSSDNFYSNTSIRVPPDLINYRNHILSNTIHSRYDDNFFKWRLSNMEEQYKELTTTEGMVIYKTNITNKYKVVIIGDILLLEYKYTYFKRLMNLLFLKEKPVMTYTYIFNTHPYYSFYLRKLFLPNPKRYNLNFGFRALNNTILRDIQNSKWALSYIDIDTF